MKIKKIACLLMALAMIWMTASCHVDDSNVTELTDPPGTQQTNPPDPGTTDPADPGTDGPSKPVDPTTPSDPAPSEPDVPTEPSEPADPVIPSEPDDPIVPSEPGHEHEYVAVVTKATCIEVGYTTYTCDCGDTYVGDRIEATGHQWSDWVVTKEPTVDETGEAVSVCAMCENTQSKVIGKVIPNHTHSYSEKVTKAATCSAEGVMTLTCDCGDQFTKAIAKTAHSYKSSVTKPTCEEKGYTTYTCKNCGYSYKDNYKDKGPHCYSWETVKPTCTEYGSTLYMCDECLYWYEVDIVPATGHSYKETVVAPTCSEKGYTLHKCSACGDSYKDNYTDIVDHSYSVVSTTDPTIFAQGSIKYKCSMCSDTYTEFTDPLTGEAKEQFLREVAVATLKYINQFRVEQGDTVAVSLPVLTLIAEERAVQLQDDFRHDSAALRELYNQYQYGEWVDGTPWGGSQYYNGNAMEAIQRNMYGGTADEMGYMIAESFRTSSGHWAYVGSSDYTYIGIGISYDTSSFMPVKICVLQTSENYG